MKKPILLFLFVLPFLQAGCGGSGGVARPVDSPSFLASDPQLPVLPLRAVAAFNLNDPLVARSVPVNLLPSASSTFVVNPFGAIAAPAGLTVTFNGSVQGATSMEPATILLPMPAPGPETATPNPALVSGRGNIDMTLDLSGLPPPPITVDAVDVNPGGDELANLNASGQSLYFSRTTREPNNPAAPNNRPFRSSMIRNGALQLWLMARAPTAFTTTAPPVGQRQALTLFYRARADAGGTPGSLRGFTGVGGAGAPPAGTAADDVRVQIPGVFPSVGLVPHRLVGTQLQSVLRVVGLPPFRPDGQGTARIRVFVFGEQVMDAATTGGFEVVMAPRNVIATPVGLTDFMPVLIRTVPANEAMPVDQFKSGIREFGIGMSIEPPDESGVNLVLRNPIDVALFAIPSLPLPSRIRFR